MRGSGNDNFPGISEYVGISPPPIIGRILVVDDELEFISIFKRFLVKRGYEVLGAGSADEALELMEPHGFDLAFVDIQLPGMSGLELVSEIKRFAPSLPVVIVTAHSSVEYAVDALRLGASDFLSKPLKLDEVGSLVEKLILKRVSNYGMDIILETLSEQAEGYETLLLTGDRLTDLAAMRETYRSNADSNALYAYLASAASEMSPTGQVVVSVLNSESGAWTIKEAKGFAGMGPQVHAPPGTKNTEGETHIPPQVRAMLNSHLTSLVKHKRPLSTKDLTTVPMRIKGHVFGALHVFHFHRPRTMTAMEMGPYVALSEEASLCLENALLYEKIYENLVNSFRSMVDLVEYKDPYIKDHSKAVCLVASSIAREMGCSHEEVDALNFSCYFHDLGKVAIRDDIIQKKGPLSNEEYEVIKTHTIIGEKLLEPLSLFPMEMTVIRHHHERIDGSGYPDGLTGEETSLFARITAVADVYDAMTSDRSYRPAFPPEEVMAHLRSNAGKEFDPLVVEAFESVVRQNPQKDIRRALAS